MGHQVSRTVRRFPPSTKSVIAALGDPADYGAAFAIDLDAVTRTIRPKLKTTLSNAREWLLKALTDPAQTELVCLSSDGTGAVDRLIRDMDDADRYTTVSLVDAEDGHPAPTLYLDWKGQKCNHGQAVTLQDWIVTRANFDQCVATLTSNGVKGV